MSAERRFGRPLIPAILIVITAAIYLPGLQNAPLYLSHDEIVYSLQAQSIATTGRDFSGRLLPMYIEYPAKFGRPTWDQPMLIYAIAATLKLVPFSEFTIRLPMVLAAIVDVLLVYFIARLLFDSERFAIVAALLLAATPTHFMHSRLAIDFQLAVPFVLGWLLSTLLYLRRGEPRYLIAAGLVLGAGLYGYVAAYLIAPISLFWTCVALYMRREPLRRYSWLIAGFVVPTLISLPWMLRSPLPFRDVIAHYTVVTGTASSNTGAFDLVKTLLGGARVREAAALYAGFWDPRFLFIDGPLRFRATDKTAVLLLPLAGLVVIGIVRALRRRSVEDVLLVGSFLSAPIPASFAGEAQAVWRELHMAPLAVLLAVSGAQYLWVENARGRRIAALLAFGIAIGLAIWYHDDLLLRGQGLVRASTVPLAVAGLAILLLPLIEERVSLLAALGMAAGVLLAMHAAYVISDRATTIGVILLAAVSVAATIDRIPGRLDVSPTFAVAVVALLAGHFMYAYVDYGQLHRLGPVPASLVVLAARLMVAFATTAVALIVITTIGGDVVNDPSDRIFGPAKAGHYVPAAAALVLIQLAYFFIDHFSDYRLRAPHAAAVFVAAAALTAFVATKTDARLSAGRLAVVGFLAVAALQFGLFYRDYFTDLRARGSAELEGNARVAFETIIERARQRSVPAIYLGKIGPYAFGDLYWKFYLIKHRREDLEARTIPDLVFNPDRVRTLPPGTIVITSPSRDIDAKVDEMVAAGVLTNRELLKAPDGAPIFWILETAPP